MIAQVLVVDDEFPVRELCARVLSGAGYTVETASSGDEAAGMLSRKLYDVVLSDLKMPGELSGQELVKTIEQVSPTTDVIVMAGFPTLESAVETLKHGAFDYLVKPFNNDKVLVVMEQCLVARKLSCELD